MKVLNETVHAEPHQVVCEENGGAPRAYPQATSTQYPVWRKNQGEIKQVFVTGDPGADGSPVPGFAQPDPKLM